MVEFLGGVVVEFDGVDKVFVVDGVVVYLWFYGYVYK